MVACLIGCLLAHLLGRSLACLLALFGLLSLLILICFAWLICEARSVNLLALDSFELARLMLCLAYLLACPLTLLCLLCVRSLVCLAWADCAWLARTRSSLCLLERKARFACLCVRCLVCLVCFAWADCVWLARSRSSLCSLGPNLTCLGVYSCGLACSA